MIVTTSSPLPLTPPSARRASPRSRFEEAWALETTADPPAALLEPPHALVSPPPPGLPRPARRAHSSARAGAPEKVPEPSTPAKAASNVDDMYSPERAAAEPRRTRIPSPDLDGAAEMIAEASRVLLSTSVLHDILDGPERTLEGDTLDHETGPSAPAPDPGQGQARAQAPIPWHFSEDDARIVDDLMQRIGRVVRVRPVESDLEDPERR